MLDKRFIFYALIPKEHDNKIKMSVVIETIFCEIANLLISFLYPTPWEFFTTFMNIRVSFGLHMGILLGN
jgi:hypothetical protein